MGDGAAPVGEDGKLDRVTLQQAILPPFALQLDAHVPVPGDLCYAGWLHHDRGDVVDEQRWALNPMPGQQLVQGIDRGALPPALLEVR